MKLVYSSIIVGIVLISSCSNSSNNISEIYIDHYKSECFGLALSLCMRSRSNSEEEWSLFYSQIEGFDYEWGYRYRLKINVETIENPPQDAPAKKYTLIEVLNKELEPVTTKFDIAASRASGLIVNVTTGIYQLYGEIEFSCVPQQCEAIDSLINQDLAILLEFSHNPSLVEPMLLSQVKCSATRELFNNTCI